MDHLQIGILVGILFGIALTLIVIAICRALDFNRDNNTLRRSLQPPKHTDVRRSNKTPWPQPNEIRNVSRIGKDFPK